MTFKSASKSRALQAQMHRTSDEGTRLARYAVVAFRLGIDNRRRERVFRRIWSYRVLGPAEEKFLTAAAGFVALVDLGSGLDLAVRGDASLPRRWVDSRRGVNAGADWRSAATYMARELGPKTAAEEGKDPTAAVISIRRSMS